MIERIQNDDVRPCAFIVRLMYTCRLSAQFIQCLCVCECNFGFGYWVVNGKECRVCSQHIVLYVALISVRLNENASFGIDRPTHRTASIYFRPLCAVCDIQWRHLKAFIVWYCVSVCYLISLSLGICVRMFGVSSAKNCISNSNCLMQNNDLVQPRLNKRNKTTFYGANAKRGEKNSQQQ